MAGRLKRVLRKRRWRPSDAEFVLDAQAASGLSMVAFALENGVLHQRLQRWTRRLQGRATAMSEVPSPLESGVSRRVSLLAVRVRGSDEQLSDPAPRPAVRHSQALTVSVGPGVVHVPIDFDIDHLRRVIEALAPC